MQSRVSLAIVALDDAGKPVEGTAQNPVVVTRAGWRLARKEILEALAKSIEDALRT